MIRSSNMRKVLLTFTLFISSLLGVAVPPSVASAATPTIPVGSGPRMFALDQSKHLLFVTNYWSNTVSVVDSNTDQVLSTIAVDSGPHGIAVDGNKGLVVVVNNLSNSVSIIDESSLAVVAHAYISDTVWGVAIDSIRGVAYVTTVGGQLYIINEINGGIIRSVAIGNQANFVAVDSVTHRYYASNFGDNSVSVLSGDTDTVVDRIAVTQPQGVDVDSAAGKLYVSSADGNIYVFDTSSDSLVAKVLVGSSVFGVSVDPSRSLVFAVDTITNSLIIMNGSTYQVIVNLATGDTPHAVAFESSTNTAFVGFLGGNAVSIFDVTGLVDASVVSPAAYPPVNPLPNLGLGSTGLGIDTEGNIYMSGAGHADASYPERGNCLTKFGPSGSRTCIYGRTGFRVFPDGSMVFRGSDGNTYAVRDGRQTLVARGVSSSFPWNAYAFSSAGDLFIGNCNQVGTICKVSQGNSTVVYSGSGDFRAAATSSDGSILFADCTNGRVLALNPETSSISNFATGLNYPQGVAVDGAGNVFVGASFSNQVIEYNSSGSITRVFEGVENSNAVAISTTGEVYVARWFGGISFLGKVSVGVSPAVTVPWAPDAPTVTSSRGSDSGSVTWSWTPNKTYGFPVVSYTWSGACSGSGNVTSVTCTGLNAGTSYSLNVTATNVIGTSEEGSSSILLTSRPEAPTVANPSFTSSGTLTWTWSPNSDGGSSITSYTWSGACSGSGNVTTVTCSGLTGGTNYTLSVSATNAVGTSETGSSSLMATTQPNAPTVNTPTSPSSGQLTWTWSPNSDGGSTITNYTWTGACSGSGNVTTVTCSGLTGGNTYTLNVTATNAIGTSGAASRQGLALTVPGSPAATASPGDRSLVVTWVAPSSGGTPITGYTVTASAGGRSFSCVATTLTCTITGLANATTYLVSMIATNTKGNSTPSTPLFIYPAPDTKFLAFSPTAVALVKSNVPVFVANAKPGSVVTVSAAGSSKTCIVNIVGECAVNLNSSKAGGWVIVASYLDGKKTVAATTSYRINLATITVSTVQVAKGKSFTVKMASGAPGTQFKVVTSAGDTFTTTLTGAGAGTITVPTKAKGPLTLTISDNGTKLQTTTIAVV